MLNVGILSDNIKNRAEKDIKENNICGASVAVISPDETLYKAHFGALSAKDSTPLDDSVLFRMASMTKPVTAVAIMALYDKGLIDIDDPVENYLPQFADRYIVKMTDGGVERVCKAKTTLTVKHLLTHTSGLLAGECGVVYADKLSAEANKSLKGTVDYYSSVGLSFEPYTKNEYSPTAAFDVLARLVEVVSDTDYAEFVKKYITEPCGMTDTVFVPREEQWRRIIPMHTKENGKSGIFEMKEGCVFDNIPVTHY